MEIARGPWTTTTLGQTGSTESRVQGYQQSTAQPDQLDQREATLNGLFSNRFVADLMTPLDQ